MQVIDQIDEWIVHKDVQLLIFDCDGTLMDTLSLHYQAWSESFAELGYSFISESEFVFNYAGVSGGEMVAAVIKKLNYGIEPSDILIKKKRLFMDKYIKQVKPIINTLRIVEKYHGRLKMVVASGGAKPAVIEMLKLNNLLTYFEQVIAIEDVKRGKPSPEIFLMAAASQQISPEKCLVFEDHHAGFLAAQKAGMDYIDVTKLH